MISNIPLAERLRPHSLDEVVGQKHLIGEGKMLNRIIAGGVMPSIIFWGPPGVGKTTIARILATRFNLPFFSLSAVNAGVKEVREVIAKGQESGQAVLFLDEIHRFSKSQQDSLLSAVESGVLRLIGATTENPSFEIIQPLLSRCQVFVLESSGTAELATLLNNAVENETKTSGRNVIIEESDQLLLISGGDARKLLNTFELIVNTVTDEEVVITNKLVKEVVLKKTAFYDKSGEQHYDIISA